MWGKVSCLRKQHDGRQLGLEPPTVQCANHYTTPPSLTVITKWRIKDPTE